MGSAIYLSKQEISEVINLAFAASPYSQNGLSPVLRKLAKAGYDMNDILLGRATEGGSTLLAQAVAWDCMRHECASPEQQLRYSFDEDEPFPARVAVVLEQALQTYATPAEMRSYLNRQYFGQTAKMMAEFAVNEGLEQDAIYRSVIRMIDYYEKLTHTPTTTNNQSWKRVQWPSHPHA